MVLSLFRLRAACTVALLLALAPMESAQSAEVWVGGSRAWPDFVVPGHDKEWSFVAQNADGFYINNFGMRLDDKSLTLAPTREGRLEQLRQINRLFKNKKLFYETDLVHSSDEFDSAALQAFADTGFQVVGSTINYGNSPSRTAILTRQGQLPLYYMFGPWHGGGDIQNPENAKLRDQISQAAGGSVDGPVTMWRKDAGKMKEMCYSTIRWTHANGKKFLYLLAPNDSGADFLPESQKLAHDMEDNEANPDIWAVSFYGPPIFRAKLESLPEADDRGRPAATFSGTAYWLIHHLRDPDHNLNLAVLPRSGVKLQRGGAILDTKDSRQLSLDLTNGSTWLDLAPLVRARVEGEAGGWQLKWKLGERDVSEAMNGAGLSFIRELRLQPGDARHLTLQLERAQGAPATTKPVQIRVELLPHPSETTVNQSLELTIQ